MARKPLGMVYIFPVKAGSASGQKAPSRTNNPFGLSACQQTGATDMQWMVGGLAEISTEFNCQIEGVAKHPVQMKWRTPQDSNLKPSDP